MHATYHKISAREREEAPRFYYKRAKTRTVCQRLKGALRVVAAFIFTQVGVVSLLVAYSLIGAGIFGSLEAESQMEQSREAARIRARMAKALWNVTLHTNVLFGETWKRSAVVLTRQFQEEAVRNIKLGYTGADPGVRIWTYESALMYSITVFTTIGYGNLTPKTDLGKLATIMYAVLGIPLMFLYMRNMGSILGDSFKYVYAKLCRCNKPPKRMPSKATMASALTSPDGSSTRMSKLSKGSSFSAATSSDPPSGSPATAPRPPPIKGSLKKPRPPSLHFDPPSSPSSPDSPISVSGFMETPLTDSMPDFSVLQSSPTTEDNSGDVGIPTGMSSVANNVGGVKELLTVPGQQEGGGCDKEGDKNPFFSRSPRHPDKEGDKSPFFTRSPSFRGESSFFRKNKNKGSSSADGGDGGDKSSSPLPPSSSTLWPPSPPPPPRKTNTVVEFKLVEDIRLVTIPVSACLLFLTFYIILGTMLFSMWEGWSYLDGAYFCFTSLMTIGFGDFVPGKEYIYGHGRMGMEDVETRAKLVMGNVYILLGMSIVSMSLNLMWEKIVQNIRTAMRRIGLMRPARYDDN